MKTATSVILLFVCTCLALGLIITYSLQTDAPDHGATPPSTGSTNSPENAPLPEIGYSTAVKELLSAQELAYSYCVAQTRQVRGETYSETRTGTANFAGLHTGGMEALILEDVTYGSYNAHFTESYSMGRAHTQVRGTSFVCEIAGEDFLARQIPAALLEEALYQTVEVSEDHLQYTFSNPTALESWADPSGQAELVIAGGTVTLDAQGRLTSASYHAEYTLGSIPYTLEVTLTMTGSPDFSARPEHPENCPTISDLDIPRYMLATVDGVYSSNSISSEHTESVYLGILPETYTKSGGYYLSGSGDSFASKLTEQTTFTTFTGSRLTTSKTKIYQNGKYLCSLNGDLPYKDDSETPDSIRLFYEDSILSSMVPMQYIQNAQLSDNGDFWVISIESDENYVQYFTDKICALFNLDTIEFESITTKSAGGYLIINKYTGLPTAMGLSLERTHVTNGISYRIAWQKDQSLTLACPNAYETITGEAAPKADTQDIKPLFYQVTGSNGQRLWLLGTMNVGDDRAFNLPAEILDALSNSNAMAVEYDPKAFAAEAATNPNLQGQIAAAYFYSNSSAADHLPEELHDRAVLLMQAAGKYSSTSKYLRPIIWNSCIENLYLTQGSNLTANSACDQYLLQIAKLRSLPIYQMESGLSRLQTFTGLSDEVQAMLLQRLLDQGMLAYCHRIEQEYELWCQGDEASLLAAQTAEMTKEEQATYSAYYDAVVTDRTRIMFNAVSDYLESGETVFCTVNVANLLGEEGLLEALRSAGYTVRPVSYS